MSEIPYAAYYLLDVPGLISNGSLYGVPSSVRRAKYPMATDTSQLDCDITDGIKRLAQSGKGEGHDQFLTGIIVQFDLTFSVKAWIELERYHFIDFVSSQSTMHRITRFDLDAAYNEYVDQQIVYRMKEMVAEYNEIASYGSELSEAARETLDRKYLEILYSNPCGFRLTAGMTTNYRQLKTIYAQRKNHRLPEWRSFCKWIKTLPYSELIIGEG